MNTQVNISNQLHQFNSSLYWGLSSEPKAFGYDQVPTRKKTRVIE